MSDDSPSPPESRPRLRLRTDKTAGGAPPASTGLQSPAPGENHPPEAPPPAPSAPPVSPREPVAASPAPPAPLPVRLKPRISIRPAESERAGETIAPPGSQPALPRIGSDLPAPPRQPPEKVVIDLGPPVRPPQGESPAGAIPLVQPKGGERTEAGIKVKLKPVSSAESSASPGVVEVNLPEVIIPRPTAVPSLSVPPMPIPAIRAMPTLVPAPGTQAPPAPASRRPSRGMLIVLALFVACVISFLLVRVFSPASKPAASANARPAGAKPPGVAAGTLSTASRSGAPAAADHPQAAGHPAGRPTPGSAASPPEKLAEVSNPAFPAAPTPVNPPPPPEPSPQFRAFVDHLKVNGVRTGPPARLFVDGLAWHPGDLIDGSPGVVFVGIDPATNEIIFKDDTGAIVRRRF